MNMVLLNYGLLHNDKHTFTCLAMLGIPVADVGSEVETVARYRHYKQLLGGQHQIKCIYVHLWKICKKEFCIYKDIKRNRPNAYRYEQAVWVSQSQSCQMIRFEWGNTKEWLSDCVRDDETQITGSLDTNSSKISMTYIIIFCKSQSH